MPQVEESSTRYENSMRSLAESVQTVRLANLEEQDLLQKGMQKTSEPKEGQTIWFYKNPDDKKCGITFGTVQCRDVSDYVIKVPNGDEIKLGPEILYLILGQEENFPHQLT